MCVVLIFYIYYIYNCDLLVALGEKSVVFICSFPLSLVVEIFQSGPKWWTSD